MTPPAPPETAQDDRRGENTGKPCPDKGSLPKGARCRHCRDAAIIRIAKTNLCAECAAAVTFACEETQHDSR